MPIVGFDLEAVARHEAAHGVITFLSGAAVERCCVRTEGDHFKGYSKAGMAQASPLRIAAAWAGYAYDRWRGAEDAPANLDEARTRPVDPTAATTAASGVRDAQGDPKSELQDLITLGWDLACVLAAQHHA